VVYASEKGRLKSSRSVLVWALRIMLGGPFLFFDFKLTRYLFGSGSV